jgi:pullulanase/glycogen debranching enzyme
MTVWPGQPFPLGATWDGEGTNFAIFSENATEVELCLFDARDAPEASRVLRLRSGPRTSGTATCPGSGRAATTATGWTGRTSRPAGCASTPSSC